jgi:2-polyprenyl-6-hydroxyphenyl methylase/3-demethylubiquinone-9 3-methyltransferase
MSTQHAEEIAAGSRFAFGANWTRFLIEFNETRLVSAEQSLRDMLGVNTLEGKRFLDIGSGSGLFSLAARRLGARVHSFDYDPQSVACTRELKRRFYPDDAGWAIEEGSALDAAYLSGLGRFDVVYSWGVLHHTGDMNKGLANVAPAVAPGGLLFIALYNDQGFVSRYWTLVKIAYNRNAVLRLLVVAVHSPYLYGLRWLVRALSGRAALQRGMSPWHDMIDWLGGYPFEVARPEAIFRRFRDQGFILQELRTCGGRMGCNEYVFRRAASGPPQTPG